MARGSNLECKFCIGELRETIVSTEALSSYEYKLYKGYNGVIPNGVRGTCAHISKNVLRDGTWHPRTPSPAYTPETPVADNNLWPQTMLEGIPDSNNASWYAKDCVWGIDSASDGALSWALFKIFNAQNLTAYNGLALGHSTDGPIWLRNLYHNGTADFSTIEAYTSQLARSLTVYTRRMDPLRNEKFGLARGSVIKIETCIQVRWIWITFPAGLVGCTVVFLLMTIWNTSRLRTEKPGIWKSSSLAVLFSGVEEEGRQESGVLEKKSDMERRAKEMRVSLKATGDGWRLG